MPSLETLWSFFGISLLLALSPGPDNLFVLVQSAQQGWRAGLVGYLNVLAAQATVLSAHNNLLSVRNRRLAASVVLLKNLAGDWQPTPSAAGPSPAAAAAPG